MPRITALCLSDEPGEYQGQQGRVKYQQLALLDQDAAKTGRLKNTFDYRMIEREQSQFAGKCEGKIVVLDVRDFVIFSSRLRSSGSIVSVDGKAVNNP